MATKFEALGMESRGPADQNAVDLFRGRWISDFSHLRPGIQAGHLDLFSHDPPQIAARELGKAGRLDGFRVLELGPLEGAHSFQLERLGAESVLAIEANPEAYLKCLITKEVLGMQRVRFMLGDFIRYLEQDASHFDLVFASGVLYHMSDPLHLLRLLADHTNKLFLWTHFQDEHHAAPQGTRTARRPISTMSEGLPAVYYVRSYDDVDMSGSTFLGGVAAQAAWMEKDAIINSLIAFGFDEVRVAQEDLEEKAGPNMSLIAVRAE